MANLQGLDPRLRRVQRRLIAEIDALSAQIEAGEITPEQWAEDMQEIIGRGMNAALMAGKGSRTLTNTEQATAARLTAVQYEYLNNFLNEILEGGWLPSYTARAQMYGSSTTAAFSMGDVVRQAGQVLPLPSMPTEGTQCLSNCGCEWRIENINEQKGDFNAYWELGKTDNCQTCVQRRADWYPVLIRGNKLLL